jgi:uncharacterized protein (TIGR02147 family)
MKTTLQHTRIPRSFRALLEAEFARRSGRNPRYSLRAYARALGVSHATLSQILRSERAVSMRTIESIGPALGLARDELEEFGDDRAFAAADAGDAQLARNAAEVVGDWHHFAILELVHLRTFRPDVRWIATSLGILPDEVNAAVARLLRLHLLRMDGPVWVDLSENITTRFDDVTAAATDRLFADLRAIAARAMAERASQSCARTVTTIAVDSRKMPQALAAIEAFRADLSELLRGDAADAVATLEIHLYPLTRGPG